MSRETAAKASHHHSVTTVASGQKHDDFYLGSTEECSFELSYEQHLAYALWLCSLGLLLSIAFSLWRRKPGTAFMIFRINTCPIGFLIGISFTIPLDFTAKLPAISWLITHSAFFIAM
ncbi:hypothetical protein KUH03_42770 [Sphingobacterium sp. E70]|uniref:hypothetical protein n=1 Tax=Sphingobacterium sp. E70 TaxID=2853439 RepID=UPI00211CECE4|nr:hypothetical protein [Sphingobacterium sp. E70]ULT25427.1 hypothetical protein KUH03_42770 [Sphingobacterium sp. E70]